MFIDIFMLTLLSGTPRAGLAAYGGICEGDSWATKCFQPLLSQVASLDQQTSGVGDFGAKQPPGAVAQAEARELLALVSAYFRGVVRLLEGVQHSENPPGSAPDGLANKEAKRFLRAATLVFGGGDVSTLVLRRTKRLLEAIGETSTR